MTVAPVKSIDILVVKLNVSSKANINKQTATDTRIEADTGASKTR